MADTPSASTASASTPVAPSDLSRLAAFVVEQARRPIVLPVEAGKAEAAGALLVPQGYTLQPLKPLLDAFRTRPEQRAGTTQLNDLASFIAWTVRHQDFDSVVYCDDTVAAPSLTAVIDHDEAGPEARDGRARYGRHRGTYAFPFSREWKEWSAACAKPLDTGDFAAFVERRIADVVPPPYGLDEQGNEAFQSQDPEIRKLVMTLEKRLATPSEIVRLARGVEINASSKASVRIDRDTGEHQIEYAEENGQGAARLKPPNAFLVAIPVLHNDQPILIAVHLRYRASGGRVLWFLELHQPERVVEEVLRRALAEVEQKTGLRPLRGLAPQAR
jgi:hypothetical protein